MRSRLAAAFVLLTFVTVVLFGGLRLVALHDLVRVQEAAHVEREARRLAVAAEILAAPGTRLDKASFARLLTTQQQAEVTIAGRRPATVSGPDFAASGGGLESRATSGPVTVTLRQSQAVVDDVVREAIGPMVALGLLLTGIAGLLGFVLAGLLAAPFRRLALAASALGRGRFDLDLPASRIPEASTIADSLRMSAAQIERGLRRERELLSEASHEVRTPLTSLRLELEELQLHGDLPDEALEGIGRGLRRLDRLDALTDHLLSAARGQGMLSEARISVERLARDAAADWSAALGAHDLEVTASVEGDLDQQVLPGPVEQILDLVREDLARHGRESVRLEITGAEDQLRLHVRSERAEGRVRFARTRMHEVRRTVAALGGRCTGDPVVGGLRVWLPVR